MYTTMRRATLLTLLLCRAAAGAQTGVAPIRFTLDKPGYVTLVIEDAQGRRVRNLISETQLPAGQNTVVWDGYDDGERDSSGDLVRHRVAPGAYRARGLSHDGLHLRYEFPVYSGGNPPWHTADGAGAWLADHSSPCDVLALPAGSVPISGGRPALLFSARVGEAGDTLIVTDEAGNKIGGGPKINGWDGANALARDAGPRRDPTYFAYTVNLSKEQAQVHGLFATTVRRGTNGQERELQTFEARQIGAYPGAVREGVLEGAGLAVHNGLIVTSAPWKNRLYFFDSRNRAFHAELPLARPRGLMFDAQGHLYVLTGGQLKRYLVHVAPASVTLSDAVTLIASGLEDPCRVTTDPRGDFYISDWGKSHNVKVFSPSGQFLRTIGSPGGPQLGLYNPQRMQYPAGVALTSRGDLWVAESHWLPKRVSRWTTDGRLLAARYGPPRYGGGGTLDPKDPTRLFYADYHGILEFTLDWKSGTSRLKAIVANEDLQATPPMPGENWLPERPVRVGGRTYLIGGYQGGLRGNTNSAIYLLDEKTQIARPVAFLGSDRWWPEVARRQDILAAAPNHQNEQFMTWRDLNRNQRPEPGEFAYRVFDETFATRDGARHKTFGYREFALAPDLSAVGSWSIAVPAPTINADGVPLYDLSKATFLLPPDDSRHWGEDGDLFWPGKGGWLISGVTGYRNGERLWHYPEFPDDSTLPTAPGQYIAGTRLLGPAFTPAAGESGELFVMNGEMGNMYVFTTDGLFVQTLGGDARTHPLIRVPEARRGMLLDGYSFAQEHFHPTITRTDAGEVYLVAGFEHSSLFHVEGWNTIRRREFGTVRVTEAALAALPPTRVLPTRKQARQILDVAIRSTAPDLADTNGYWNSAGTQWARIDEQTTAAVALHGDSLYAVWKTGDPGLLTGAGGDFRYLFKQGGALDIQIGANLQSDRGRREPVVGDVRLLVTRAGGKVRATLYRAVTEPRSGARTLFESPVGRVWFDDVVDVSAQVRLEQSGGTYLVAAPLSVLGWAPQSGQEFLADIGLLRGNGVQTTQRVYWNNLDTAIVSDIPSEARLQPSQWGAWRIR